MAMAQLSNCATVGQMNGAAQSIAINTDSTPAGWARLAEIARATGKSVRTLNHQLRDVPDHAKCKDGRGWRVNLRFVPDWHRAIVKSMPKICDTSGDGDVTLWDNASVRRDALIRRIVEDAESYVLEHRVGRMNATQLERTFCRLFGRGFYALQFGHSTLHRWRRGVRNGESFPELRGRRRGALRPIGAAAESMFLGYYLSPGVTLEAAFDMVEAEAADHKGDKDWSWPSVATVRRWLKREHPKFFTDKYRRGADHWRATHQPKLDRDPMSVPANQIWEIDGSKCNFFGRYNGNKTRFTYILVVDVGSRMIVGHAVGRSESTELLVRALRRAVLTYGAPKTLRADQGKANRGAGVGDSRRRRKGVDWREITGVVQDMKADYEECTGRSGWQKGTVESMVNVVGKNFDPLFSKAYVGHNSKSRIRGVDKWADEHIDQLKTVDEVDRLMGDYLKTLNNKPRRDMEGLSPVQKFNKTAIPMRVVPESVLKFRLLRAQRCRVSNKGVVVRLGTGATVHFGQGEPRIWELIGERVIVRIDDDDIGRVLVCDLDDKPLFYVHNDHLRGLNSETLRESGKLKQRASKHVKEHWDQVDINRMPVVEVALQMKDKSAALKSAKKLVAETDERERLILHSEHSAAIEQVQASQLRKAVGAECDDRPSLMDVMANVEVMPKDTGRPSIFDIDFDGQEDHDEADGDPLRLLMQRSDHDQRE